MEFPDSFCLGVISGNINPPGGYRRQIPDSRKPRFRFVLFLEIFSNKNMLVRYRRINNKGVLERPGTTWKVLRAISTTLKFQYFRKVDFLMSCKTKSRENVCLCLRMVRAITLDTPRPHKFHLKKWKNSFCEKKKRFFSFLLFFCPIWPVFGPIWP